MDQALRLSGDNRAELEKVLTHYQDSGLKYEAARFLIEHMPGCQGTDSLSLEKFRSVYDAYDSISRVSGYETDVAWGERIDSLADKYAHLFSMPTTVMDLRHMKADYLIREIDRSFEAWRRNVYVKDASFEDFCEYVLPYRRLNGLVVDHARDTFHRRHADEYYIKEGKHWLDETDSLLYEYRHLTHSGICGGLLSLGVFAFSSYPFLFLEFILAFLALLVACAIDYRKVWIRVTVLVLEKKAKVESTAIRQMREEVKKLLEEKE